MAVDIEAVRTKADGLIKRLGVADSEVLRDRVSEAVRLGVSFAAMVAPDERAPGAAVNSHSDDVLIAVDFSPSENGNIAVPRIVVRKGSAPTREQIAVATLLATGGAYAKHAGLLTGDETHDRRQGEFIANALMCGVRIETATLDHPDLSISLRDNACADGVLVAKGKVLLFRDPTNDRRLLTPNQVAFESAVRSAIGHAIVPDGDFVSALRNLGATIRRNVIYNNDWKNDESNKAIDLSERLDTVVPERGFRGAAVNGERLDTETVIDALGQIAAASDLDGVTGQVLHVVGDIGANPNLQRMIASSALGIVAALAACRDEALTEAMATAASAATAAHNKAFAQSLVARGRETFLHAAGLVLPSGSRRFDVSISPSTAQGIPEWARGLTSQAGFAVRPDGVDYVLDHDGKDFLLKAGNDDAKVVLARSPTLDGVLAIDFEVPVTVNREDDRSRYGSIEACFTTAIPGPHGFMNGRYLVREADGLIGYVPMLDGASWVMHRFTGDGASTVEGSRSTPLSVPSHGLASRASARRALIKERNVTGPDSVAPWLNDGTRTIADRVFSELDYRITREAVGIPDLDESVLRSQIMTESLASVAEAALAYRGALPDDVRAAADAIEAETERLASLGGTSDGEVVRFALTLTDAVERYAKTAPENLGYQDYSEARAELREARQTLRHHDKRLEEGERRMSRETAKEVAICRLLAKSLNLFLNRALQSEPNGQQIKDDLERTRIHLPGDGSAYIVSGWNEVSGFRPNTLYRVEALPPKGLMATKISIDSFETAAFAIAKDRLERVCINGNDGMPRLDALSSASLANNDTVKVKKLAKGAWEDLRQGIAIQTGTPGRSEPLVEFVNEFRETADKAVRGSWNAILAASSGKIVAGSNAGDEVRERIAAWSASVAANLATKDDLVFAYRVMRHMVPGASMTGPGLPQPIIDKAIEFGCRSLGANWREIEFERAGYLRPRQDVIDECARHLQEHDAWVRTVDGLDPDGNAFAVRIDRRDGTEPGRTHYTVTCHNNHRATLFHPPRFTWEDGSSITVLSSAMGDGFIVPDDKREEFCRLLAQQIAPLAQHEVFRMLPLPMANPDDPKRYDPSAWYNLKGQKPVGLTVAEDKAADALVLDALAREGEPSNGTWPGCADRPAFAVSNLTMENRLADVLSSGADLGDVHSAKQAANTALGVIVSVRQGDDGLFRPYLINAGGDPEVQRVPFAAFVDPKGVAKALCAPSIDTMEALMEAARSLPLNIHGMPPTPPLPVHEIAASLLGDPASTRNQEVANILDVANSMCLSVSETWRLLTSADQGALRTGALHRVERNGQPGVNREADIRYMRQRVEAACPGLRLMVGDVEGNRRALEAVLKPVEIGPVHPGVIVKLRNHGYGIDHILYGATNGCANPLLLIAHNANIPHVVFAVRKTDEQTARIESIACHRGDHGAIVRYDNHFPLPGGTFPWSHVGDFEECMRHLSVEDKERRDELIAQTVAGCPEIAGPVAALKRAVENHFHDMREAFRVGDADRLVNDFHQPPIDVLMSMAARETLRGDLRLSNSPPDLSPERSYERFLDVANAFANPNPDIRLPTDAPHVVSAQMEQIGLDVSLAGVKTTLADNPRADGYGFDDFLSDLRQVMPHAGQRIDEALQATGAVIAGDHVLQRTGVVVSTLTDDAALQEAIRSTRKALADNPRDDGYGYAYFLDDLKRAMPKDTARIEAAEHACAPSTASEVAASILLFHQAAEVYQKVDPSVRPMCNLDVSMMTRSIQVRGRLPDLNEACGRQWSPEANPHSRTSPMALKAAVDDLTRTFGEAFGEAAKPLLRRYQTDLLCTDVGSPISHAAANLLREAIPMAHNRAAEKAASYVPAQDEEKAAARSASLFAVFARSNKVEPKVREPEKRSIAPMLR